jgi:hypothetical protein
MPKRSSTASNKGRKLSLNGAFSFANGASLNRFRYNIGYQIQGAALCPVSCALQPAARLYKPDFKER